MNIEERKGIVIQIIDSETIKVSVINEEQGVIIIKLQSDVSGENDNFTTGLAYNSVTPVITTPVGDNFTIELPTSNTDIEQNKTFQITPICKNNSTVITSPILTYVVSDATICSVDSLGLVTAIKVGSTAITVKYENVEAILNVNVTEAITIVGYEIWANATTNYDYINLSSLRTWKVVESATLLEPLDKTFTFRLSQSDLNPSITPQQLITLLDNQTTTKIRLTANASIKGSFYLIASVDGVDVSRLVRIKGLTDL